MCTHLSNSNRFSYFMSDLLYHETSSPHFHCIVGLLAGGEFAVHNGLFLEFCGLSHVKAIVSQHFWEIL